MVDMRQAQHGIVQRLRERTEMSVDIIERTVAMTGLKLDELLASIGGVGISQGGPFVAGDYTGDFAVDAAPRSEERPVWQECVSMLISRCAPNTSKKNNNHT